MVGSLATDQLPLRMLRLSHKGPPVYLDYLIESSLEMASNDEQFEQRQGLGTSSIKLEDQSSSSEGRKVVNVEEIECLSRSGIVPRIYRSQSASL